MRIQLLQNQGGHAPSPQRYRYADCNARIPRIIDDYPNRPIVDYLGNIAHNLSF